jgi:hypothetical protein
MFIKKSKYSYRSRCRICISKTGRSFSPYFYATPELTKIATRNRKLLDQRLSRGVSTCPTCPKCNVHTDRLGKLCVNCKKEVIRVRKRRRDKRRDKKKAKIKLKRRVMNLANSYIRSVLIQQKDRKLLGMSRSDIPQDLIDLKRKQLLLLRKLQSKTA